MAIYAKLGNVKGDVTAKGHQGWIKVNKIDDDVGRQSTIRVGQVNNRSVGAPSIKTMVLTRNIDIASPLLRAKACAGKPEKSMTIDICHTDKTLKPYLTYTLTDPMVTAYRSHVALHTTGRILLLERLEISYTKIEMRYIPQDESETSVSAGYDSESGQVI